MKLEEGYIVIKRRSWSSEEKRLAVKRVTEKYAYLDNGAVIERNVMHRGLLKARKRISGITYRLKELF